MGGYLLKNLKTSVLFIITQSQYNNYGEVYIRTCGTIVY